MRELAVVQTWSLPLSPKQREGFAAFTSEWPQDFVVAMCPGSGKTRLALACAYEALRSERVDAVAIVVPSTHLRVQWAREADSAGIALLPDFRGRVVSGFSGGVLTFAGIAAYSPAIQHFVKSRRVLAVFDEVHHTSEWSAWGSALETLFGRAAHRISLSGTPFRRDGVALPWYRYDAQQHVLADVALTYREARALGLVRPVVPYPIAGEVSWTTGDGRVRTADMTAVLSVDDSSGRLRAVLEDQTFVDAVISQAHNTLVALRPQDRAAGGIAFAMSVPHAKMVAARITEVTGTSPVVVVSEDADADARIQQYRAGREHWIVAVRKVSEGVDIPRLRVCAYLTNVRSEWAVPQLVGRIMRRAGDDVRPSYLFYPADPLLDEIVQRLVGNESAAGGEERDRCVAQDDEDVGLQRPVDPWLKPAERSAEEFEQQAQFEARAQLRKQHTEMVKAVCKSYGVKPVEVYRQLKREFHTPLEIASVAQLRSRIRYLAKWLANGARGHGR